MMVLVACSDSENLQPGQGIRFDALEVGQISRYEVFTGTGYRTSDSSTVSYAGGVLVAEIVDEENAGFVVHEYFDSPPTVSSAVEQRLQLDQTYIYTVRVEDEVLKVEASGDELRSRLLRPMPDLPLIDVASPQTELLGWKTKLPYCECYREAFVADAAVRDHSYPRLNVLITNEMMQADGPGTTYIYSADDGLVRSVEYSWWTGEGVGFDRIAEE